MVISSAFFRRSCCMPIVLANRPRPFLQELLMPACPRQWLSTGGSPLTPGHIWKCLDNFDSTTGSKGGYAIGTWRTVVVMRVGDVDAAEHSAKHRAAPWQRMMLLLRNHCQKWRHEFMSSSFPRDPRALLRGLSLCEALSCLGIQG